jgi:hypothetical protein
LVLFDKPKEVTLVINDLLREITLTEHGVAGDHVPCEDQAFEKSKGRLVLVGLVVAAVGNGCLGKRYARLVGHQRQQMHRFFEAVEAAPGRLAVEGEGVQRRQFTGNRFAKDRPDPPGQRVFEGLCVQSHQHLANSSHLRRCTREAEPVHERDVLVLCPLANRRVTLCAAHDGTTRECEDRREGVSPPVPTARIGDLGKKGKQTTTKRHFHATPPCVRTQ